MSTNDGRVIGSTQIIDNGDPQSRFNLVLVAEGYRQAELDRFAHDADHFVKGLFQTAPYNLHLCAINVWRLDVASDESGADDPASCGGTGATPRTYFDASFCAAGVPRALGCDSSLVLATVAAHVPHFHSAQVIVNSAKYGGSGGFGGSLGKVGVASTATENSQGLAVDWREILIHEMGHSIYGLADEYAYYLGCETGEPHDRYFLGEPYEPNVTASPLALNKWDDLINTDTLPTWKNPDCSKCPPEPGEPGGPVPNTPVVGTFEGARYYHCDAYHPQSDCKMRKLGVPFCRVCQRVIHEYLLTFDPSQCNKFSPLDLSRWAAVATILFGVIQDGGGVIFVGGRPIPIDPWGPLRLSLWGALQNPRDLSPAMRDVLVGTALIQLASLTSPGDAAQRLQTAAQVVVDRAAASLPAATIR
jgi:hypothetical protein